MKNLLSAFLPCGNSAATCLFLNGEVHGERSSMKITQAILDGLTEQAKNSPRLRMNLVNANFAFDFKWSSSSVDRATPC